MKLINRVLTFMLIISTLASTIIFTPTTVHASDRRLPATFYAERQINTYNMPGGTINGFLNQNTTGKQVVAWGFWSGGREYWRVSFNLFAGGRATRYIRRYDLVGSNAGPVDIILPRDTRVFQRSCLSRQAGTVWGGQRARDRGNLYSVLIAGRGNVGMIIYALDAGGGRIGWINVACIEGAIRRSDGAVLRNMQWVTDNTAQAGGMRFPMRGPIRHTSSSSSTGGFRCDFIAFTGTRLYAPGSGTVEFRQTFNYINGRRTLTSWGNSIYFTSSCRRYSIRLAHLHSFHNVSLQIPSNVTQRQTANSNTRTITIATRQVNQGDFLGTSGNTGNSWYCHLHIDMRIDGRAANPATALRAW